MKNLSEEDKPERRFKILVWRFGHHARRKYVNGHGYTGKARDVFAGCNVR